MNNRHRSRSGWGLSLITALLVLRCGVRDVVVAESGAAGTGGTGGTSGTAGRGGSDGGQGPGGHGAAPTCFESTECGSTGYCSRLRCSDPHGECRPRPLSCGSEQGPSCGCDGVSYWNDCLREQFGVTSSTPGQCVGPSAASCAQSGLECPVQGASCGKLAPPGPDCGPPNGACWMLPAQCGSASGQSWVPCMPGGPCQSLCDAVRLEQPFRLVPGAVCP